MNIFSLLLLCEPSAAEPSSSRSYVGKPIHQSPQLRSSDTLSSNPTAEHALRPKPPDLVAALELESVSSDLELKHCGRNPKSHGTNGDTPASPSYSPIG
jgi:hypothetical protein